MHKHFPLLLLLILESQYKAESLKLIRGLAHLAGDIDIGGTLHELINYQEFMFVEYTENIDRIGHHGDGHTMNSLVFFQVMVKLVRAPGCQTVRFFRYHW